MSSRIIGIDGKHLTPEELVAVTRGGARVKLLPAGRMRAAKAHETVVAAVRGRAVYGRTTGVGANKTAEVAPENVAGHGKRLLRSHAAGAGPAVKPELVRAMLVTRLNQLAAGGAGVNPALLDVLATVINQGLLPPVKKYGGIGTGDLTALATTALCITGEIPWMGGVLPPQAFDEADALAFMSSSAATVGEAAVASYDINRLLRAGLSVAGLSCLALHGSGEAFAGPVQAARPHRGQRQAAAALRRLLGPDLHRPAKRVQDSYGLRALPQVHGPAIEAARRLRDVIAVELNSAAENPLIGVRTGEVLHNGNFHLAELGLGLDGLRAAFYGVATLSVARLAGLMEPALTRLHPFLADGSPAGSGLLITEYVAQSALAELRGLAAPSSLASAVLSRGTEEHASFATQAAWQATASVPAYETVLACELVAAMRALRQEKTVPAGPLKRVFDLAAGALDTDSTDRPLEADITAAATVLRSF